MGPADNWLLTFPESRYAQELARGNSELRFSGALEGSYRGHHLARVKRRARVWFIFTLGLAAATACQALTRYGPSHFLSVMLLTIGIPSAGVLAYLSWSSAYERRFIKLAPKLVLLLSAVLSISVARAVGEGRGEVLALLTLNLFAIFFFCGLLYRDAVIVGTIAFSTYILAALYEALSLTSLLNSLPVLLLATVTAALVKRDIEGAYRRNYLESSLLGELVARDGLTGLMNRRAFDEHLRRVWQQCLRDGRPLGILMIDIDHFKNYNDRYGHLAGDAALRAAGRVISEFSRRPLDMAARYGGEEFVVILYDLPLAHVEEFAEKIRKSIAREHLGGPAIPQAPGVTASIGVGYAVPTLGRAPEGIVQLADEALYEAKLNGRDRVVCKGLDAYQCLKTGMYPRLVR